MTTPIYIVGHKNPDTDSICAAIAYANLKRELGNHVIACRAGDVNRETGYVLEYFDTEPPFLLTDLYCRVKDLLNGENITIRPGISVLEAWMTMRSKGVKSLPVVDENYRLLGLVTAGDLAEKYLTDLGEQNLNEMQTSVENILKTLGGTLICGSGDVQVKGKIFIWSDAAGGQEVSGCLALIGNDPEEQRAALRSNAACLILAGGAELSQDLMDENAIKCTVIIKVPMDIFTAARMLLISVSVGSIMLTENLVVFNDDDLLAEVKKKMLETRFRNYPVVDERNRVLGAISRYHLLGFSQKKVILVDHNELSQAVDGAEEAQIVEVVDHHKVGGVQTGEPILFRNEPLGATCTLIAKTYFEHGVVISTEMAGLLCAGILSDTMVFKSPTCTQTDREIVERLGEIAGIEPLEFGIQMLKKGSALSGLSSKDVLSADYKEFWVGKTGIGVGQVNVMGLDDISLMKNELLEEMGVLRRETGIEFVLLMITDLLSESTGLLISGNNPKQIGDAFAAEVKDNEIFLPAVLSRKKQVVPPLMKHFTQTALNQ